MPEETKDTAETTEQIQEDTQQESATSSEDVQALLDESSETGKESQEEEAEELTDKTENDNLTVNLDQQANELLITTDDIKDFPELKPYLGKPLKDIRKFYKALRSDYREKAEELAKLKNNNEKQAEENKKTLDKVFDSMPDSIDDPEGFKDWIKEAFAVAKQEARDEALKEVSPKLLSLQESESERQAEIIIEAIKSKLPEGVTYEQALTDFMSEEPSKKILDFYDDNPEIFVKHIIESQQLKSLQSKSQKTESEIEKQARLKAADKIKQGIRQGNRVENEKGKFNAVSRIDENLTPEDNILLQIQNNLD